MEVELYKSYFTLQCNLETDGRAWAYLNEFMCIGKNRNDYFVCLTSSIPIEMTVAEGGAKLSILHEKKLFTGRRPAAQSILQFTLKHWKALASLSLKRETTGCLLIPSMGREELSKDRDQLVELVKAAMPEVRAEWHVQSLEDTLRTTKSEDKREQFWLEEFPHRWQIFFGGVVSVSSASIETNLYTRETVEFDYDITPMLGDFSQQHKQTVNVSELHKNYCSQKHLGLVVELESDLSKSKLLFRVIYNGTNGRESKEIELGISADHIDAATPDPRQYMKVDRIVLSLPDEKENLINILIKDEEISEDLSKVFDRNSGVSVRLDRFLGRR